MAIRPDKALKNLASQKAYAIKQSMNTKIKNPSPLVEAVLKLDNYLAEIVRLGAKIEEMELKSDFDFEQVQRLMTHFAECGQGVTDEVMSLSKHLNEARALAETAAQTVSARAELLQARQEEHQKRMDDFRSLGERVRELTMSLNDLKQPEGAVLSEQEQAKVSMRLGEFQLQLEPLINEARHLKTEARNSKMKTLEQGAQSLEQSLTAIGSRLESFTKSGAAPH
jgi:HPt (histidine-containing phosphotransfer) domain-containing protein